MENISTLPPKIRRRHDAEETRLALLRAAEVHFAERGFAAANMREVARDAHAASPLINRYFGGKEGLYLEVHRQVSARVERALREGLAAPGDAPPQADVVFRFLSDYYRNHPTLPRLKAWWLLERGDLRAWPDLDSRIVPYQEVLAGCQRRGTLRPDRRVDLALTLSVALADGWASICQHVRTVGTGGREPNGEEPAQIEAAFLEEASQTLLHGLAPPAPCRRCRADGKG